MTCLTFWINSIRLQLYSYFNNFVVRSVTYATARVIENINKAEVRNKVSREDVSRMLASFYRYILTHGYNTAQFCLKIIVTCCYGIQHSVIEVADIHSKILYFVCR